MEQEAVPAVVEGVEDDREAVVPADVPVVPAHLAGRQPLRVVLFQLGGDVEAVRVVEHPDARGLRHRGALVGLLLQESFRCRHLVVDRVIEHAVHSERFGQPEGAEGHPAFGVAADGFPGRGRGRPENAAGHPRVDRRLLVNG